MRTKKIAAWIPVFTMLVLSACWLLAGCTPSKKEPGEAKSPAAQPKQDEKQAKDEKSGPCGEYATSLCKIVGETSPACREIKNTLALIPEAACKAGMAEIEYTKSKFAEKRKLCDELIEKLCADVGPETKTCEMVRTQTKNFPPNRCESLMKNYDRVVEDLKAREAANKPLSKEQQALLAADSPSSFGPKNSKVTIVEFSDFQCPYCSKAANVLNQLKDKYAKKVRFVFRHFPLTFHKDAHLASQAALAAGAQGKFFEYHDMLFKNQRKLKRESLEEYAQKLELDLAKFKKALDDKTFAKEVDADMELGKKVAVRGTPTMFLNGKRVKNPADFKGISKEIDEALKVK